MQAKESAGRPSPQHMQAPTARTCAQPAHVHQQRCLRVALRHALPHGCTGMLRVEHLRVHAPLPDVDALLPAAVAFELVLQGRAGQVQGWVHWARDAVSIQGMRAAIAHRRLQHAGAGSTVLLVVALVLQCNRSAAELCLSAGPVDACSMALSGSSPCSALLLPTFMAFDVTSVRSAMRVHQRMIDHMGCTRPAQVYLGMYSGMWVW